MYFNRRKFIIKNIVYITFILLLAVVSTHYIYYKFKDLRSIDYSSSSLDIVFNSKEGEKVTITKVTPVTDSVGLSTQAYNLTIKNNLTIGVSYRIKLIDDLDTISNDNCSEKTIPKEYIRVAVKEGNKRAMIYKLDEIEEDTLDFGEIKALDTKEYAIRVWISNDEEVNIPSASHYHGLIQVVENDNEIAIK